MISRTLRSRFERFGLLEKSLESHLACTGCAGDQAVRPEGEQAGNASFDRRKCKGPLNGPTATGQHCPEGWTLYPFPASQLKGVTDSGSAEASYYDWVDQFDTFGLGKNTPIATGNGEDGLMALVNGKWVVLRVPYPIGFFAKGLDGRIDDPKSGWKGKGLWSTYATRAVFHVEGGKGTSSKVLHFQLRPDPLAN
jgi:hypothetical protein